LHSRRHSEAHDPELNGKTREQQLELMSKLAEHLPTASLGEHYDPAETAEALTANGPPMRGPRKLLDEIDPQQHYGGLRVISAYPPDNQSTSSGKQAPRRPALAE
jgi:hypothetical protein